MNIVFVVNKFLPKPSSNVVCMLNIANELIYEGHTVSFATQNFGETKAEGEAIRVYYVPRSEGKKLGKIRLMMHRIKSLFVLNIFDAKLKKDYVKTILGINGKEKIDIIVCVQHPIESLEVGMTIKELLPNTKVISYFLDPIEGIQLEETVKTRIINRTISAYYRKVIKKFDKTIMPEYWKGEYCRRFCIDEKKVYMTGLPNLQKECKISKTVKSSKIKILFAGNFYNDIRGIEFFNVFTKLFDMNSNIELHLYSKGFESEIAQFCQKYPNNVFSYGFVNKDELEIAMGEANIFLNISNRISSCVPGKLFEYFSYAKPIINYQYICNDPAVIYNNKYPLLYNIQDNEECDIIDLLSFINLSYNKSVKYEELINNFKHNLPKHSADLLTN